MRRKPPPRGPLLLVLVLLALGAGGWWAIRQRHGVRTVDTATTPVPPPSHADAATALAVPADRIDPANEGRLVAVSGSLRGQRLHDPQLGVEADAVALFRVVEMLQWSEDCSSGCRYALAWSSQPIDSSRFRDAAGHANPPRMPFANARFVAERPRLGAWTIDPALAAESSEPVVLPVHAAQLQPNLAASFRDRDGALHAGEDAGHAAAGDLRVSFRIVAGGEQRLVGVQSAGSLKPPPKNH